MYDNLNLIANSFIILHYFRQCIKDWYNIPIVTTNTNYNSLSYEYVSAYTPWAVMNYVNDVYMDGENTLPRNYWTESRASTLLERLFI